MYLLAYIHTKISNNKIAKIFCRVAFAIEKKAQRETYWRK